MIEEEKKKMRMRKKNKIQKKLKMCKQKTMKNKDVDEAKAGKEEVKETEASGQAGGE